MKSLVVALLICTFAAVALGFWYTGIQVKNVAATQQELSKLNEQLGKLRGELHAVIIAGGGTVPSASDAPLPGSDDVELKSAADVSNAISKIGANPNAQSTSDCLAALDAWSIRPDDETQARQLKLNLATRLRGFVKKEVIALQQAALVTAVGAGKVWDAPTCAEASKQHAEAGRILAMYPMSEDKLVIDDAKSLSAQQADVANRIESIRRQRYNLWATGQIGAAIDGYNSKSSYWSPKKENGELMDSLVRCLADIDPVLLEPVVLELYNYVVDLTKNSIAEWEKTELAKRMSNPSVRRRTLGDF